MNWDNSDNSDNWDNSDRYTLTDARRLWMVWWNRNAPDLLNLRAKHHAEGQRAFQSLLAEARSDLRTDEAVERVAEAIYRSHDSYTHFTAKPWAEMVKSKDRANKFRVKQDRMAARAAITALLEEQP